MNDKQKSQTILEITASWIRRRQISVYLQGREKPMTGLTVCDVRPKLLIARWNSSTHLIPWNHIQAIRFSPDCDPCRDVQHPLYPVVSLRPKEDASQPTPKPYPLPKQNTPDGMKHVSTPPHGG